MRRTYQFNVYVSVRLLVYGRHGPAVYIFVIFEPPPHVLTAITYILDRAERDDIDKQSNEE